MNATLSTTIYSNKSLWFVVRTNSRAENKVCKRLEDVGFTVFLPTYTSVRIWSDRKKKLTLPLIPSTVFVQSEVSELNNVYKVHGVVSVLKYLGRPAVVRDVEIENLRIVASELNGAYVEQTNAVFEPGESVQVIRGPLQGLYGTSVESEGKHRLIVMIECLDLAYSVSVPRSCVRKIDHQAA